MGLQTSSAYMKYVLAGLERQISVQEYLLLLQKTWLHSQHTHGGLQPTRFFKGTLMPSSGLSRHCRNVQATGAALTHVK